MKTMTVGKSSRTPLKHWILNSELGRLVGVFGNPIAASKVPAKASPFLVVDLCAGDGVATADCESSPAIITKHLKWAAGRGVDIGAVLIEKDANTFSHLQGNTERHEWLTLIHGDARDWVPPDMKEKQAVFIHSDPNSIKDWPITESLMSSMTETTTMLATLGCNVGGLKRMKLDQRVKWYDHVREVVDDMPSYHDAVIISLTGDKARWAYLLRVPSKWTGVTCSAINTTGRRFSDYDFRIGSLRNSRDQFTAIQDYLFLTNAENAEMESC